MPTGRELSLDSLAGWADAAARGLTHIDLRPAWRDVSILLVSDTREHFDAAAGPDGVAWAPFKRVPSRKRGGASAKLLRDTGLLMGSYVAGAGHVELATATSLVWGSNVDRAAWHHYGTRTVPARPQIGFTDALLARIDLLLLDRLAAAVEA